MPRYIQGKDGKMVGSIGEAKDRIPTPSHAPKPTSSQADDPTEAPYDHQYSRLRDKTEKPTRVENGVVWTEAFKQERRDGWTIVDETAPGTYVGSKSDFYSGVVPGAEVEVRRTQWIRPDGSVSHETYACNVGGAGYRLYDPDSDVRLRQTST